METFSNVCIFMEMWIKVNVRENSSLAGKKNINWKKQDILGFYDVLNTMYFFTLANKIIKKTEM